MENGLKFEEFAWTTQNVRTAKDGDTVWFVGKDIAKILGYKRPTKAITDHVDEEDRWRLTKETQSQFGIQLGQRGGWLINEYGVHDLVLSSELPEAKRFKRWVTHEVLPSICKTGQYIDTDNRFNKLCPIKFDRYELKAGIDRLMDERGYDKRNSEAIWRRWYIDFSQELGFNINTKAKQENITKVEWLDRHGFLQRFYEFIQKAR